MTHPDHIPQDHLPARFAPAERVLPVMLSRQADRYGDRRLFVAGDVTWTYAQARDTAAAAAGTLERAGIGPGDRVAIMGANHAEFMQIFLGCAWLGAVAVPINIAAKAPQIHYVLKNSGARLLVIDAAFVGNLDLADLADLALAAIWTLGAAPGAELQGMPCGALPAAGERVAPAAARPGDTVAIIYTSGTTGPSKGVCCPHAQYFWWGATSSRALGVGADDVLLTTLPLFHINALSSFAQALLTGATLVVEPRFSASGLWRSLARHRATVTYLLGAMVPILLARDASPEERAHDVRIALGPGVPGHLHGEFARRTGIVLVEGYGSTETNFVIGGDAAARRPGAMGRVRDGFHARVVDGDDNEVADGEAGELILRADEPFAFATGYFGMTDQTIAAWRNLWFHTGDRVTRDSDGDLWFVDRLKDAIRRRGENISSFEVEQVLMSHPDIATAAVYPVPSELAEDEVMAAIVRRAGSALDAVEVIEFCRPRLAAFAVPRFVEFVDDLPRTENGKVQKFKLRQRGVTAAAFDRQILGIR
jgi:crotonobetaine/carnitine-CoA ligase